jgi:hypothetical protein
LNTFESEGEALEIVHEEKHGPQDALKIMMPELTKTQKTELKKRGKKISSQIPS